MNNDLMTIQSSLINKKAAASSGVQLTKAVETAFYAIAAELDRLHIPLPPPDSDRLTTITISTTRLKGANARDDNRHLKKVLFKLRAIELEGEKDGRIWGDGVIAGFEYEKYSSFITIKLTPKAVEMFRSAKTYAKVEANLIYSLDRNARKLYLLLADKARLNNLEWIYTLDDLRDAMGLPESSYKRWDNFKNVVLSPSIKKINKTSPVIVDMEPLRVGKKYTAIRFFWKLKTQDEVVDTITEAGKHSKARFKKQQDASAPPITDGIETKIKEQMTRWALFYRAQNGIDPTPDQTQDREKELRIALAG